MHKEIIQKFTNLFNSSSSNISRQMETETAKFALFENLPLDTKVLIMTYLDTQTLGRCAVVSHSMKKYWQYPEIPPADIFKDYPNMKQCGNLWLYCILVNCVFFHFRHGKMNSDSKIEIASVVILTLIL